MFPNLFLAETLILMPSTRYLYNGSYVRLRNVQLAYAFAKTLLQKWNISNLSIYVRGTNLFTWAKDK